VESIAQQNYCLFIIHFKKSQQRAILFRQIFGILIAVSCVIATSLTLLAILLVYLNRDFSDVSADCRLTDALPTQFWQTLLSLRIFLVLLSVLFYIPIAKRLTGVSKKVMLFFTFNIVSG
jgi:hypothetical protein